MNKKLFNEWAYTYNDSILRSEQDQTYPFYGYGLIQRYIHDIIHPDESANILEMGIGTGMMTKSLYNQNRSITGVDFSEEMIKKAKEIMPNNQYINSDFFQAVPLLSGRQFDYILFSYSIHHLKPTKQKELLQSLSNYLTNDGVIIIGDVMTENKHEMMTLMNNYKESWDEDEYYPIFEEFTSSYLKNNYVLEYKKMTFCSGIITLTKK